MSEHDPHAEPTSVGRRRARRRRSGCLPILVALVLVVVGGYFLVTTIELKNPFATDAEDFPGPGSGVAVLTVAGGDTISTMAQNLEELGVVASAQAFVDATADDDVIREGVYRLKKEMKASDVVTLLVGGKTKGTSFTFTSGKTVDEVVTLLAKDTDIGRRPEDDAITILSAMVARTVKTLDTVGLAAASDRLGYSQHDLLTIASLVEAEGSLLGEEGKAKIARVIYNRLANPTNETIGRLQLDATVNYALGKKVAVPTQAQIDSVADSPYNTYTVAGLPPGPIATPSVASLTAATAPAKGPWLYYATVDLESGETRFAVNYDDFLELKGELRAYCDANPSRCGR
jgi:UPF0755 protein